MLKTDLFWPHRCAEPVDAYRDKDRDRDREKKRGSLQRKIKEDIKKIGKLKKLPSWRRAKVMVVVMLIGFFFCGWGDALVLTSGAGRPRSAPVIPIFRSRSRRESAVTTSTDLLARTNVVHDGRGHLLYWIPHLQLLIRCLLLLLLLLLLLRHKHETHSGQSKIYYRLQSTFRFKLIPTKILVNVRYFISILMSRVSIRNFSCENIFTKSFKNYLSTVIIHSFEYLENYRNRDYK